MPTSHIRIDVDRRRRILRRDAVHESGSSRKREERGRLCDRGSHGRPDQRRPSSLAWPWPWPLRRARLLLPRTSPPPPPFPPPPPPHKISLRQSITPIAHLPSPSFPLSSPAAAVTHPQLVPLPAPQETFASPPPSSTPPLIPRRLSSRRHTPDRLAAAAPDLTDQHPSRHGAPFALLPTRRPACHCSSLAASSAAVCLRLLASQATTELPPEVTTAAARCGRPRASEKQAMRPAPAGAWW